MKTTTSETPRFFRPNARTSLLAIAMAIVAMASLAPRACAATKTWSGKAIFDRNSWHNSLNWLPRGVPGGLDDVFINRDSNVRLKDDVPSLLSLTLDNGADLFTSGHRMNVIGNNTGTTIGGDDGPFSNVHVQGDGSGTNFWSSRMTIGRRGNLALEGGTAEVIQANSNGNISGRGKLRVGTTFHGGIDGLLKNDHIIGAVGGDLRVEAVGGSMFDLDGTGSGNAILIAFDSVHDLTFDGPLSDDFNGLVSVGAGNTVSFEQGWTLGSSGRRGTLLLSGDNSDPIFPTATVRSSHHDLRGDVVVIDQGRISGSTIFRSTAAVEVANADDRLTLASNTTFQGGSYTGDGVISQMGSAQVAAETEIDVDYYDWDGAGDSHTTIHPGARFAINSRRIETGGGALGNEYNGTVNVNGGTLAVNTHNPIPISFPVPTTIRLPVEWNLGFDAVMNLSDGTVTGSPLLVRSGTINATAGESVIGSRLSLAGLGFGGINVAEGAVLRFDNETSYLGIDVGGDGTLVQNGGASVRGAAIDAFRFDMDGSDQQTVLTVENTTSTSFAPRLIVNSSEINTQGDANHYEGEMNLLGGVLTMNTPGPWLLDRQTVDGPAVINLVETNGNVPEINGAEFIVGNGTVNVTGAAVVHAPLASRAGARVNIDTFGDHLRLAGGATFRGGSFRGDGQLSLDGHAVVERDTKIDVHTFDWDGNDGSFSAPAERTFTVNEGVTFTVNSTAVETGGGYGGHLVIEDRALVDVNTPTSFPNQGTLTLEGPLSTYAGSDLVNDGLVEGHGRVLADVLNFGHVSPGTSVGALTMERDYTQFDDGALDIELGGVDNSDPANLQYDVLNVLGLATLDGALNVSLLDAGPVIGDTDSNGAVDITDLNNIRNNFGAAGEAVLGDTNGDGLVDVDDLNNVRNNFGVAGGGYSPALGDSFDILTAGDGITGAFAHENLPELPGGLALAVEYQADRVRLNVISASMAPVPEPSTMTLASCCVLFGVLAYGWRRE